VKRGRKSTKGENLKNGNKKEEEKKNGEPPKARLEGEKRSEIKGAYAESVLSPHKCEGIQGR